VDSGTNRPACGRDIRTRCQDETSAPDHAADVDDGVLFEPELPDPVLEPDPDPDPDPDEPLPEPPDPDDDPLDVDGDDAPESDEPLDPLDPFEPPDELLAELPSEDELVLSLFLVDPLPPLAPLDDASRESVR
jgi:hypothetical protein